MKNNNPAVLENMTQLLALPETKVTAIKESKNSRSVILVVESTREKLPCRQCGKSTNGHGVGRVITLRHLPLLGKETYLEITPRRGICNHCDDQPTTTEQMDWYEPKHKLTKPYEQHLLFELINSTVSDVSRKENIDYHTVENLIDAYIDQAIDYSKIKDLCVLGLDEISIKKGYRDFVTLITYRIDNKVHILGVIEGREKAEVERFLKGIPQRLRRTVCAICCDLYEGYMNACQSVFKKKVPVVTDRFHVRKLYRKSLVSLRKSELQRLRKELGDKDYQSLKAAIAILKKQKDYFTEEEKPIVKKIFDYSPKLKIAYQFSRELTGIFDSHITQSAAKEKLSIWMASVMDSKLECFNAFIKTLSKHQEPISNYFIQRNTSGFVEGFNNKVKVLKRRCYGLSSAVRLFQRLLLDTMGMVWFAPGTSAF